MSRRIPTDKGGQRGPQSSRIGDNEQGDRNGRGRYRDDDRRANNNSGSNTVNNMPFPMNFPGLPNGMPMLPGFPFSFPQQQNGQQ